MGFSTPLGLLALLALPAILFLHLFRRRFEERRVAGLFLFAPDALPTRAGRTRTRLLQTPSLWLELLAALCLALLLSGFHVGVSTRRAHRVLVLDDSASMGAVVGGSSAADRARREAQALLADLDDDALVTVLLTGTRPEVLAGPRAPKGLAAQALEAWSPGRPTHDASPALALGLDLAEDGDAPVFLTDREDPAPPPAYRHVGVGVKGANAAILGARRILVGTAGRLDERVFVDVSLFGPTPHATTVRLEAWAGGETREIAREDVTLEPSRTLRLAFRVPRTEAALRVRLGDDALARDNEALLLPDQRAVVRVAVDLPDDVRAALRLDDVLRAVGGARVVEANGNANGAANGDAVPDLAFVLEPGLEPGRTPEAPIEVVVRPSSETLDAWVGPYLLERRRVIGGDDGRPLLAGVSLEGVIWSAGDEAPPGLPLVLAGDAVLLAEERDGARVRLHLNLLPTRSNLAASPDWPILVSNLLDAARRRLPGPRQVNVTLGEEIVWRVPGGGAPPKGLVLFDPNGARRPARGFGMVAWAVHTPGLHRLVDEGGERARYAARFVDAGESDLRAASTFDRPPADEARGPGEASPSGRLEARLLALLLLLALAADWFFLGRRS